MPGVSVELVETPCDSLGSGHSSIVTGLPNWKSNKSWQNIRLLFGADPVVPYNENSLYSLYCMAYKKSNFESNIKQHLPRHMLGYLQEKMGSDTAKLGWSRGTYMDTYAPALPKNANLGTHGYKVHENYGVMFVTRKPSSLASVRMQRAFLKRSKVQKTSLGHQTNGKCVPQQYIKSALFKLPALQNPDVRNWMSSIFPVDLKRLKDSEKEPLDLARIQNEALRLSHEEVWVQLVQQTRILERMEQKFERRTADFSPAKGYSNEAYPKSQMLKHFPSYNLMTIHSLFTPMHKSRTPPQLLMQKRALVKTRDCMKLTTALSGRFSVPHLPEIIVRCMEALEVSNEMTLTEVWKAWSSRKFWERFREIPEWIETETSINSKSPEASISELEALRNHLAKRSAAAAEATVGTTGPIDGSDNLTSGNGDGAEATSSSTIPAKRKAPIASRAKSAKFPKSK
ncbi:hypothetical protein C8J57DRAFT_1244263 [Mycena rebaudengoi]|nr:hypothetical protein C8J57DRAFT_1244263 [Mycena rebaudengoi]